MWIRPYKKMYAYTLYEILADGLYNIFEYAYDHPHGDGTTFSRSLFTNYELVFPSTSLIPEKYIDDNSMGLLNQFIERYWYEYIFESEEEYHPRYSVLSYPDILAKAQKFLSKVIGIIERTYQKYTTILDSYDTQRSHLLDKLQRIIDQDTTNTGTSDHDLGGSDTRRDNDTPQDSGDFDTDTHTSFITAGETSGHDNRTDDLAGTLDSTESWDEASIIEKLDKIQRLYQKTMLNWLDEFKGLFIEGANYHEI